MATSNTLTLAAGAVLVLCLSAGIAYVTATAVAPDTKPGGEPAPAPVTNAELLQALESLDRRMQLVEERARRNEDRSQEALDQALELAQRMSGGGTRPAGEIPNLTRTPEDGAEDAQAELEHEAAKRNAWLESLRARRERHMISQFDLLGDASPEAERRRKTQTYADAQQFAVRWGLKHDDADRAKKVHLERMDLLVEKLGPHLREGLEKASITAVREQWKDVVAETDRRLREIFDEDTWERYESFVEHERDKPIETLFARIEKR